MSEDGPLTIYDWLSYDSLQFFGAPAGRLLRELAAKITAESQTEMGPFPKEGEGFELYSSLLIKRYSIVRQRAVYRVSLHGYSDREQERQLLRSFAKQLDALPDSRLSLTPQTGLMLDPTKDPAHKEPAGWYLLVHDALTVENTIEELEEILDSVTFLHEVILEQNLKLKLQTLETPEGVKLEVSMGEVGGA